MCQKKSKYRQKYKYNVVQFHGKDFCETIDI